MPPNDLWSLFAQTGKIEDYLAYRRDCLASAETPAARETSPLLAGISGLETGALED